MKEHERSLILFRSPNSEGDYCVSEDREGDYCVSEDRYQEINKNWAR